jgi:catechol 2,3-dioxygenase-like lactoylglutathione lyase family enzyme
MNRKQSITKGEGEMNPEVSAVLIGVKDVAASKKFYAEGLGCPIQQDRGMFVQFNLGDGTTSLGLYAWDALAKDAGVPAENHGGFRGFTLSYIVPSAERVDEVINAAKKAGAEVLKPAAKQQWGGYSGTFADPDGYVWKVAADAA